MNCRASIRRVAARGFAVEHVDGIPVLLSGRDRQAPLLQEYLAAYDAIAADDLETSIEPTPYLERKAERFFSDLGDLEGKRVLEVGVAKKCCRADAAGRRAPGCRCRHRRRRPTSLLRS